MKKPNDNPAAPERAGRTSEADFLADQAAAAQRAMSATLERMRAELGESADLAAWTRQYPWPTMGVAAAAGFLAAVAIGSPASSRRRESSAAADDSDAPDEDSRGRHPRGRRLSEEKDRGMFYALLSEVLRNFATAAQGALLAAIGARFQSTAPPDNSPPVADPTVVGASDGNGFATSES